MLHTYLFKDIVPRSLDLLINPWLHRGSIWLVISIVLISILIHLYFGRYKSEELGWNSAFGNSISLFWICVILFRFIFENNTLVAVVSTPLLLKKFIIVIILAFWLFLLLFFNFFHILPKKLTFLVSSADFIYPLAYVIISIIYGNYPMDRITLYAALLLFLVIAIILYIIKYITPTSKESEIVLEKRAERKKKKKAIKKAIRAKKIHKLMRKLKLEKEPKINKEK